jgi:hypothetical protein
MEKFRKENNEIIRLNGGKKEFRKRYENSKGLIIFVDRVMKQMNDDNAAAEAKKNKKIKDGAKKYDMSVTKFKRLKKRK